MRAKIIRAIFLTSTLVTLGALLINTVILYYIYSEDEKKALSEEIVYIKGAVEEEGVTYLDKTRGNLRITIVKDDGTVTYDSSKAPETLENHAGRDEIKDALSLGSGSAVRNSETTGEDSIYASTKLIGGDVLRIASRRPSLLQIFSELAQSYLFILTLALILSYLVARVTSRRLIEPINRLDVEDPKRVPDYPELDPLISKIDTQKKKIAEQLEEAKKHQNDFEALTKSMNEGLIITDENGGVISSNEVTAKLLERESLEEKENVLDYSDKRQFVELIKRALVVDNLKESVDITIGERIINVLVNPVFSKDETKSGLIILLTDVTEKVKRERLRREYLSNVSHELKTPLTSILGYAEIMSGGIVKEEDVPEFSKKIYDEAKSLRDMVEDLLTISVLDEKSSEKLLSPVNLKELIEEIFTRLTPYARTRGIELKLLSKDSTEILGNEKILTKLFYNLIENSIKYNKDGGKVNVSIEEKDGLITVSVEDTGIGIAPSEQERVFERFYRSDKSRSKRIGGTGLGLAIVKHAAAYHGAKIDLKSEVNIGTKITLEFTE